jgi:HEPN domain-containing protein
MSDELQIARGWLAKAMNDLLNADNNLAASEVPYDTVCFHCQQAAEKLLKAYLVGNGHPAPRTHDLLLLLERVLPLSPAAEPLRDALSILAPYGVEIRYPDDWFMPSEEDAREARDAASQVLNWLEMALREIFPSPPGS